MILNNVVPMTNQTIPFVSCFTSWLIAMSKSTLEMDKLKIKHQNLYRQYIPVTGSGVGALWNESFPVADLCFGTGGDNYLKWAMQYAGYDYVTLDNDKTNRQEFISAITESIKDGHPVMAQGLIGSTWCLVTGYEEDFGCLYGWHQKDWGITANPADRHLDNGMFVKDCWYDYIKRIVICKGKIKTKLDARDIISHLVSVIENGNQCGTQDGFFTGENAFRKCIDILEDTSAYENISHQKMLEIYKAVFFFCAAFAEARVFTGSTIETSEFKKKINADDRTKWLLNQASVPFRDSHKVVYEIWAVLGNDYNFEPEYASRIMDSSVRKKLVELVGRLRDNDMEALSYFKKIVSGE